MPAEVVHLITAVIARMTLEALQRYRRLKQGKVLPTVLVMEEAHTFIKRYKEDAENQNTAAICCQVFEKMAREGRKFGLGLLLSSQRPANSSPNRPFLKCKQFFGCPYQQRQRDQGGLVPAKPGFPWNKPWGRD